MAVKGKFVPAKGRRVNLQRSAKPVHNRRNEAPKPKRQMHLPWRGLGQWLATTSIILICLCFFAVVCFGLLYGYRFFTATPYFAIKTVEIQGNSRLDSREILEIAGLDSGGNSLTVSLDEVKAAVAANLWIKDVSVTRVLPDTLIIRVEERKPAFWMHYEGTLYYADIEGRLIAPVTAKDLEVLPALEVEVGAEDAVPALPALVDSLRRSHLPVDLSVVTWVRLSTARGIEVFVQNTGLKLSIGLEDWQQNLRRLELTLADLNRRGELSQIREVKAQGTNVWVVHAPARAAGRVS